MSDFAAAFFVRSETIAIPNDAESFSENDSNRAMVYSRFSPARPISASG